MTTTDRIRVEQVIIGRRRRWRLVDEKGRLHSNPLTDKARAYRQADEMNAKMERISR
jgi:hypothetical protein